MRYFTLRTFLVVVTLLVGYMAKAQQDPYYSHFKFVKQAYNPATVGEKDDYICMSLLQHNQWLGYQDNTWVDRETQQPIQGGTIEKNVAPVTTNFNISGNIKPEARPYPIAGVGLSVYNDRIGYMKTQAFKGQAAFFLPIQGNFARLSLGVELGFSQFGYVNPNFRFKHPNDPRIPTQNVSASKFDVGFGAYYKQARLGNKFDDFYVGASLSHLNGANYNLIIQNTSTPYTLAQHIYVGTGAKMDMGANVLEPAVLIKYNSKLQIDLNCTVLNNNTWRAGLGYRQWGNTDAFTFLLGYVTGQTQFGYSFDLTASRVQSVSNNTHEIMISYCFQPKAPPEKGQDYDKTPREL
ncbi:MAG: PorP/SprF family type IX secretion system membrane protein [Flavobacteriales bacterium]|nr:PorP/SprF family type IX secretion system membrane protein [Flavobacteriales bacterium]